MKSSNTRAEEGGLNPMAANSRTTSGRMRSSSGPVATSPASSVAASPANMKPELDRFGSVTSSLARPNCPATPSAPQSLPCSSAFRKRSSASS